MTAKEYLSQIRELERQIQGYLYEIERLEALATKVTGTIRNDRVQASVEQQKMERAVARLVDYKTEMAQTIEIYIQDREFITGQIEAMENENYRRILRYRYVEGKTFEKIAVDLNYSWRHVVRLHGSALSAFKEKYEEYL